MFVVATAGHVDHGKSTLVRALTGMEPDRWAQERARGMTIDLGYAWTTLPQGPTLAFVDVPGHERFLGNMLAGVGPAPAVLFVVSADEGWRAQSAEHLAAVDALRLRHGLLVITRSDLTDPEPARAQALAHLAASSLGEVAAVAVSAVTGAGLDELRAALAGLAGQLPRPPAGTRVRLWVDRAFTVRGAGTVVTGTLAEGTLRVGDTLTGGAENLRIRGLQTLGAPAEVVGPVSRVAVNLKGPGVGELGRGSVLVRPGEWQPTAAVEVRTTLPTDELPTHALLHLGTGSFPVRIRPLAEHVARLAAAEPLPLRPGDRGILRDPGPARLVGGVEVLDVAPPALRRRGDAARRGAELSGAAALPSLEDHLTRRGAVRVAELRRLGVDVGASTTARREGDWLISADRWQRWSAALGTAVRVHDAAHPRQPGLTTEAARRALELPDPGLLEPLAAAAGLRLQAGRVGRPGAVVALGPAEEGVRRLEEMLAAHAFAAPETPELQRWRLGRAELAAAEQAGRLVRIGDIVLLPDAPDRAVAVLARLPQPFTTSAARAALDTTRRVAVPLLEHLDRTGRTRQLQPGSRVVL